MANDIEKLLETMHVEVVKKLLQRIRSGEATAADFNVARQMLKDNNITAMAKPGSPLDNLVYSISHTGDDEEIDEGYRQ